jgi:hypothetical protein
MIWNDQIPVSIKPASNSVKVFSVAFSLLIITAFCVKKSHAQTNNAIDFSLGMDYSAAEQTLDFFERRTADSRRIAGLRGNQLAAATSVMLERTNKEDDDFRRQLELARDISSFESDIYGMSSGRNHIRELRRLLQEMRRRNIERRIVATVSSFFPRQARIATRFSVYLVVIGNDRAAAFVRNVVWDYDVPIFVSDEKGEPIIVVNLARIVEQNDDLEKQFTEVLSITAHESFHAALAVMQRSLPESVMPGNAAEQLLGLVQNEGLAYLLSLQTHIGGQTPSINWFNTTAKAVERLNSVLIELISPGLSYSRKRELIMDANLSGSFEENYGSTAGLRMAYEIDSHLGRPALTETLLGGGPSFLSIYHQVSSRDASLPRIDKRVLDLLKIE